MFVFWLTLCWHQTVCSYYALIVRYELQTISLHQVLLRAFCRPCSPARSAGLHGWRAVHRLFELSKQERARSHQSASTSNSHELGFGGKSQAKPVWDAAMFGPTGLLPGQSHTPTRIGRDLHELVAQHDPDRQAGK